MNDIDIRIFRLIDVLIFHKAIEHPSEFCDTIKMQRQSLTNVKAGKQHFTTKHIRNICGQYDVNANWIFAIQDNVFNFPGSIEITDFPAPALSAMRSKESTT